MGTRRRPHVDAEFVEAVGVLALGFAGPASDFGNKSPNTRRVTSWVAEEWP